MQTDSFGTSPLKQSSTGLGIISPVKDPLKKLKIYKALDPKNLPLANLAQAAFFE